MSFFAWIVTIVLATYLFEELLEFLNNRARGGVVPAEIADLYNEEERGKQNAYQYEHYRLRFKEELLFIIFIIGAISTGLFGVIDRWIVGTTQSAIVHALLFFALLYILKEIISLPFSYYRTFVIEEKYGFNKSSRGTFFGDVLKGFALTAVIGGGVLALATLFYLKTGALFWVWGWVLVSGVSIFFAMFYTTFIAPLFNKLTPLSDGELRNKILDFAKRNDFAVKNILVMDGSKRSTKANAYFSGLGSQKTIVLFDTLITSMTTDEVVAVLAHEIGHYKMKHSRRQMVLGLLQTGVLFYLLSIFLIYPGFAQALGMEQSFYAGLLVFSFIFSPLFMIINLGAMVLSRKHELEADRYAKERNLGTALGQSLKNLTKNNYSNPTPHPWYVFFKYSHPPTATRLKKLQ